MRTLLLVLLLISWLLLILGMHDAHILKEVAGQRAPQLPAGLQGSKPIMSSIERAHLTPGASCCTR